MIKKYTKTAAFTDIHWGAKGNSEQHNQDCDKFIDWFCDHVKSDPSIDNIIFMGDWYENRNALNVMTLNYSHRGARKLNDLGLPVYFIIGNHDLYHRHTRDLYSTITFEQFSNFVIINEPTVINDIHTGALLCPYLFHDEYSLLGKHLHLDTWWGHFEFKGFVVTGYNITMPTGPDPMDFTGPSNIFSGHFHKRQSNRNITYIGNAFPSTFGDAGDNRRGMMVYDHITQKPKFINWEECPKYTKTSLSDMLDGKMSLFHQSRVKCLIDIPISFEESTHLRQKFMEEYNLREFSMEESAELSRAMNDTETSVDASEGALDSVDELIIKMIQDIDSEMIDNNILIEQYRALIPK